jgi:putative ABC transport system permease protein
VIRFAFHSFFSRKLRAVLTALAIVLGVAMISGSFVLTDSMSKAFGAIYTQIYKNTDAVISGRSAISSSSQNAPPFSASLLPKVRTLSDVQAAIGGVAGSAHLIGTDGKAISHGGAPNIGFSVDKSLPELSSISFVDGTWPGPNEVVVDKHTASAEHWKVGDTVGVQGEGPVRRMRLSGIFLFGGSTSIGGATLAGFELKTAQLLFDKVGELDQIRVQAKQGVSPAQLVAQIRTATVDGKPLLPPDTQVRTGSGQAQKETNDTNDQLSFLQDFLLAFGGIALFVGAFVIANSLSITIAQRTREFATLRTLGASRRQVLKSVLFESLLLGVFASLVGLGLGVALAQGLSSLFDAFGITLPRSGLPLETRTIVVSLLVGILVTILASLRPAIRSTRVPPIAAVREGATLPEGRFHRYRTAGAVGTVLIGFALLLFGLFKNGLSTTGILASMGFGVVFVFIGVALFSSRLVRPLAAVIGWPGKEVGGSPGRLARDNARRNPQRTASTAAALMIGLALVTVVAMLAQGIRVNFRDAVDKIFITNYAIEAQNNFDPLPVSIERAAVSTPGVAAVSGVRAGEARILGENRSLTAVQPGASKVFRLDWESGSQRTLDTLGPDGAFISHAFSKDHHLGQGSQVIVETPQGEIVPFTIDGIFKPPPGGSPFGSLTISSKRFDNLFTQPQNIYTFVTMKGGVTPANTAALEKTLKPFPNAKVADRDQFISDQISGLNTILNVLYVLLALSIVVSLFGIVNTLVLSVFERTRELGMLRAIGMTRWQVRAMVSFESVITALIGAVIGIALGIILAGLLAARLDFVAFAIPVGSVIVFALAAIVVGLLAAIFPARRAARLNPLEALQYE